MCSLGAAVSFPRSESIVEIDKLDIHVGASQLAIGLIKGLNLFIAADIDRALVGWSFIDREGPTATGSEPRIVTRNL